MTSQRQFKTLSKLLEMSTSDMKYLDCRDRNTSKIKLLSFILNHCFENGWITMQEKMSAVKEDEKLDLTKLMKTLESDENAARLFWAIRCFNEMEVKFNETGWDGDHFSSLIMTKLFEKSVITLDEKRAFDDQLNLEITERCKLQNRYPILVIRCVLQHLSVEEVKSCHLICKQWSTAAFPILKRRARIHLFRDYSNAAPKTCDRTPGRFFETFPDTLGIDPFTSFRICGNWTIEQLREFFEHQQKNLKEVKIDNVKVYSTRIGTVLLVRPFDIIQLIDNSPLCQPNIQYNTKLEICYNEDYESRFEVGVSTSALCFLKILKLRKCPVIITKDINISLSELDLEYVKFFRGGNELPTLCINEVFDLSKCKKIRLANIFVNASPYFRGIVTKTNLELNLNGDYSLDYLELINVPLINLATSEWSVTKFVVNEMPFIENTRMKICELEFYNSRVDLAVLPQSIQKMSILKIKSDSRFFSSREYVLHNLRVLHLSFHTETISLAETISLFSQSPKLVVLCLENYAPARHCTYELKLDWVPKSVEILKLRRFRVVGLQGQGNIKLKIERLILGDYYNIIDMFSICTTTHIQAKELILEFSLFIDLNLVIFLEYQLTDPEFKYRVYVRFEWKYGDFENSRLRKYVDKQSAYYVCENGFGTTIAKWEFKQKLIQGIE